MTFAIHTLFAQMATLKDVETETMYDFDSMLLNIAIFFVIMLVLLAFAAVVLASGKFKAQLQAQLSANNSTNTDSHTA